MVLLTRRRLLLLLAVFVSFAGVALYALYSASQHVPEFYAEAFEIPPTVAEKACDQFSDQAVALANDAEKEGVWNAVFSDDHINGWLATDLVTKHPKLLPPGFAHPRVKLSEDHAQIGVRYTVSGVETVAWIDLEARMTETHEISLTFRDVRAGAVPIPLASILDAITRAAADLEVPLRWAGGEERPTAIIGLPQDSAKGLRHELTKLKLGDGQLYVSGRTFKSPPATETQ